MMLSDVMQTIVEKLNNDPWLDKHHWKAAREDDGDIVNTIRANIHTSGEGCLLVVILPDFDAESSSSRSPVGMLEVVVSCMEAAVLNRQRQNFATDLHVAEHVAQLLNMIQIDGDTLVFKRLKFERLTENIVTRNVYFKIQHVLEKGRDGKIPKSPNP